MTIEDVSAPRAETMEPTLKQLDRPPITYKSALNTDRNIIHEAQYFTATEELYRALWKERNTIEALTKHHLGLGDRDTCKVATSRQWLRGGFNVCIPVKVQSPGSYRKLILRCAMPYKLAETENPGSVDEKMGCEVGAYAWMQEKCPDICIPHLYGFGFSDHRHFTHETCRPLYVRILRHLWRLFRGLFGYPDLLSRYTSHPTARRLPTAYMLLQDVSSDTSQMLSNTWEERRQDPARRENLFRGMARIMLSLARIPQPRIGSFQFHNNGTITLTNRPLTCSIMILENDGTPRTIPRNCTYSHTELFITALLGFHDKRFVSNPNAIFDEEDCHGEMAAKVMHRALAHRYVLPEHRNGPFLLQLNDLHSSNIFVDDGWNVTHCIDLEWVCALPVENLSVPYWISGCTAIDDIHKDLDKFNKIREEFMHIFEEEERKIVVGYRFSLTQIMRETSESGREWYWRSIMATNAMYYFFVRFICRRFSRPIFEQREFLSNFWSEDAAKVVTTKVEEYHMYNTELKQLFDKESSSDN